MDKKTVTCRKNPIIPLRGVCDPHMHVFDNRVWLHASHDADPESTYFCMRDWQVWSSADCVEWQLESVVHPEGFYMGPSEKCWAVDCEERNGKYYFYFSDGGQRTGVGVGDSPAGPFREVLGKPLLDGTVTPTLEYDPCVFKDDDGEYYLVFGGPKWCGGAGYYIARLNEDMVSFAEAPRPLEVNHPADDKASLNKFNGKYYLTYGGYYAISDNVYGPYKFMGNTGSCTDHTSYFEWNGQIFNAFSFTEYYGIYRSSGMCYTHIRDNGELVVDPLILEYGVGQYDSNWMRLEAEWFMRGVNVKKVENKDSYGFSVSCTEQAILTYPKVRNLSDKRGLYIRSSCVGTGGEIELREGSETGRLIGSVRLKETGPRFQWQYTCRAIIHFPEPLDDVTDVCLVLKPDPGSELRLDYIHFYPEAIDNP